MRNERKALHFQMALALEEIKKHSSELINAVFFHFLFLLSKDPDFHPVKPHFQRLM